ncbi:dimethylargininase [Compostimonas suwonensis]|uniref:dimethylargininase n=1 Tax=Compostimonas suwonensis TaxID=1048394 RepID=UPI002482D910|nr:dimethylargininase [Compostimonas suwonensis]
MSSPLVQKPSVARRTLAVFVSALAVTLVAHLVIVLAFFIAGGAQAIVLAQISDYFLLASTVAFVVLVLLGLAGSNTNLWAALGAGLAAAILGTLIGTTANTLTQGTALTPEVVLFVLGSLASINLLYILGMAVAAPTLGRRVYAAIVSRRGTPALGTRHVALVRPPATNLAEGLLTHLERQAVDVALADEQWDNYVQALADHGWTTIDVEPADTLPDSVFVEDAVVLFGELAVITSPGAAVRRPETAAVEASVRELGLVVERIELPGLLDGGDVLTVGTTVYVGRSGRTNADGIRQLRALLAPLGYTVVAVPLTKVLHLKSAVTALPDGTIIGYVPLVDNTAIFPSFMAVPEPGGAHVVVLSEDTVLMAASAPQSAALVSELGYRVVTVDISEFEKLEGCVTCLSVLVR